MTPAAEDRAPLAIHISELRLEVRCSDARAMRALGAAWAPASKPVIPTARTLRVDVLTDPLHVLFDGERVATAADPGQITPLIEAEIHERLTSWHPPPRVLFHAAAVCSQGRGYLLSGPSEAGKSTLARAMVEEGATYLTDEVTVFGDGRVWGLARTPQLDPIVPGAALPARYGAFSVDTESYRYEWHTGPRAVPLMPVAQRQVERTPVPAASTRVVIVGQGEKDRVTMLQRTTAAASLLDERRSEVRTDVGPLFTENPVGLTWSNPLHAARLLLDLPRD